LLCSGDEEKGTTKYLEAQKRNIPIISEEELLAMVPDYKPTKSPSKPNTSTLEPANIIVVVETFKKPLDVPVQPSMAPQIESC
jgi:hypothetical protein